MDEPIDVRCDLRGDPVINAVLIARGLAFRRRLDPADGAASLRLQLRGAACRVKVESSA
jgi:hypothetical protein